MNTPTATNPTAEAAHLEKLRSQISNDIQAMQEKEASMREYEQKLRVMVEQAQVSHSASPLGSRSPVGSRSPQTRAPHSSRPPLSSRSPLGTTPAVSVAGSLDAEWDKYQRANALLEAARNALTDERLSLKEREERLAAREQDLSRREAWLKTREEQLVNRAAEAEAEALKVKAKATFTTAPFLAARNLLSLGRSGS